MATKKKATTKKKSKTPKHITVNGRTVPVSLVDGVLRTPSNPWLREMVDNQTINLNNVVGDYRRGSLDVEKYLDLMLNIGYSVDGLHDCFDSDNSFSSHKTKIKIS